MLLPICVKGLTEHVSSLGIVGPRDAAREPGRKALWQGNRSSRGATSRPMRVTYSGTPRWECYRNAVGEMSEAVSPSAPNRTALCAGMLPMAHTRSGLAQKVQEQQQCKRALTDRRGVRCFLWNLAWTPECVRRLSVA